MRRRCSWCRVPSGRCCGLTAGEGALPPHPAPRARREVSAPPSSNPPALCHGHGLLPGAQAPGCMTYSGGSGRVRLLAPPHGPLPATCPARTPCGSQVQAAPRQGLPLLLCCVSWKRAMQHAARAPYRGPGSGEGRGAASLTRRPPGGCSEGAGAGGAHGGYGAALRQHCPRRTAAAGTGGGPAGRCGRGARGPKAEEEPEAHIPPQAPEPERDGKAPQSTQRRRHLPGALYGHWQPLPPVHPPLPPFPSCPQTDTVAEHTLLGAAAARHRFQSVADSR